MASGKVIQIPNLALLAIQSVGPLIDNTIDSRLYQITKVIEGEGDWIDNFVAELRYWDGNAWVFRKTKSKFSGGFNTYSEAARYHNNGLIWGIKFASGSDFMLTDPPSKATIASLYAIDLAAVMVSRLLPGNAVGRNILLSVGPIASQAARHATGNLGRRSRLDAPGPRPKEEDSTAYSVEYIDVGYDRLTLSAFKSV